MRKIDRYVKNCAECVQTVSNAIAEGAVLTREEYFDYYFKSILVGNSKPMKLLSNRDYRIAEYLVDALLLADKLYHKGYTLHEAKSAFRGLRTKLFLYLGRCSSISVDDYCNTLYVDARAFDETLNLEISTSIDLFLSILALASAVVADCIDKGKFQDFVAEYLINVFSDIKSSVKPSPYVSKEAFPTLKRFVCFNNKQNGKIIEFRKIV